MTGICLVLSSKLNKHLPYNPEIPLFCRDAQEEQELQGFITAKNCSSLGRMDVVNGLVTQ